MNICTFLIIISENTPAGIFEDTDEGYKKAIGAMRELILNVINI